MRRQRSSAFAVGEPTPTDAVALAEKAFKLGEAEVERLPPHQLIRHAAMRDFWTKCLHGEEVSWDAFWLHFPAGLAADVALSTSFGAQSERAAFQAALHVVGTPEHVSTAMIDAAFPPGSSVDATVARLLGKPAPAEVQLGDVPLQLQAAGLWDEAPPALPSLAALAADVAAELAFADGERTCIAQVLGHLGSGAAAVAAQAARELLRRRFWTASVSVSMKGANSVEVAAARVASALGVLSYPVVADELLRLTAFLHSAAQGSRLGVVLDAEGCSRMEELHAVSTLVTTLNKAGASALQVVVAGEGALQLPKRTAYATFSVRPAPREEEVAYLRASVRPEFLGGCEAALAAACGHQASLLQLVVAGMQSGRTTPQALLDCVSKALPRAAGADREPAALLVHALMTELNRDQHEALLRLTVLPAAFTVESAASVLGVKDAEAARALLVSLHQHGLLRANAALARFGLPPLVRATLRAACRKEPAAFEAAATGLVEHCLALADTAAAYNASNAQVAAMWAIDRERPVLDELVNLLREGWQLPAVTAGLYAELVSKHMDLLCFRLSARQQEQLCIACAQASKAAGDMLGEAHCLQHLGQAGKTAAADAAMAKAMATVERALTDTHPVIADMLLSWARLQSQAGNHQQEERLLRRSLEIQQRGGAGPTPAMTQTQTRLGGALIALGAPRRAEPLLAAALAATVAQCGAGHPDTALARCRLASCLADLKEYEAAHARYLEALDGWRAALGHCHPQFATLLGQLAFCCARLQRLDEAEQYYRRSIQMWKEMVVLDQPELQFDLRALAELLQRQGRPEEAGAIREQLQRLAEAVRAAHARATRVGPPSLSLGQALLAPLRALCMPTQRKPAFVALPAGIHDADLAELRRAAKAGAAPVVELQAEVPSAAEATAPGAPVQEQPAAEEPAAEETVEQAGPQSEEAPPAPTRAAVPPLTLVPESEAELTAPGAGDVKGAPADPSSGRKSGKSGKEGRPVAAAKQISPTYGSKAPFGSRGRGPPPGAEGGVWAASLRNADISLRAPPTRRSVSLSARSDGSVNKGRYAAPVAEGRATARKTGSLPASGEPAADAAELIRAHVELAPRESRRRSDGSDSSIASECFERDFTRQASNAAAMDSTAVIGFFNPMYSQSPAECAIDEKAEI